MSKSIIWTTILLRSFTSCIWITFANCALSQFHVYVSLFSFMYIFRLYNYSFSIWHEKIIVFIVFKFILCSISFLIMYKYIYFCLIIYWCILLFMYLTCLIVRTDPICQILNCCDSYLLYSSSYCFVTRFLSTELQLLSCRKLLQSL